MVEILVAAIPLLLLLGCLLFGFYPGCEAMVRLAERIGAPKREPSSAANQRRPPAPRSHAACGGMLIAFGHAQRPPPLAA